jgi:hypothetical protein
MANCREKQGVEASRLTVADGGASIAVGDNRTAASCTLTRRVEIELAVRFFLKLE